MYDICLLALHPLLIKKAVWVIWGYDLYDYRDKDTQYKSYLSKILFAFKKRIAKRIKCVISRNPDCALLRQWYHSTAKCFPIEPLYGSGKQITLQPDYTPKDHLNIIIGNSATQTNRHLDVLKILSKFSQENLRIYLPLSYGDMEYAKLVGDTAKELFGDKVIILDTFMPPDDYRKLIQTMDVAIFNNNRQQALGNITTSFRTGVKVYLNEDSPLCDICNEWGLTYHLISSLESISYDEFKYRDQLEGNKNSKQVYDTFKIENAVRGWTDVFNMARNK